MQVGAQTRLRGELSRLGEVAGSGDLGFSLGRGAPRVGWGRAEPTSRSRNTLPGLGYYYSSVDRWGNWGSGRPYIPEVMEVGFEPV